MKLEAALSRDKLEAAKLEENINELSNVLNAHETSEMSHSDHSLLKKLKTNKVIASLSGNIQWLNSSQSKIVAKCESVAPEAFRRYNMIREELFSAMAVDKDMPSWIKAKDRLEQDLHQIRTKISKSEEQREDIASKARSIDENRAALKFQKDTLEKELQSIGHEIVEKQRAINSLNKVNSSSREKKVSPKCQWYNIGYF